MTTRSLSVASTGTSLSSSQDISDLALLYYENPYGKVSALCQESYFANLGDQGFGAITNKWIDITSQESKSLPDEFRNAAALAPVANSKTLDESFMSNISAPFTCKTDSGVEAYFFSPNASNFEFRSNIYVTGPSMHSYSCVP